MTEELMNVLEARVDASKLETLKNALGSKDVAKLVITWSSAYRIVGKDLLKPSKQEIQSLKKLNVDIDWALWTCDEIARALVLIEGCQLEADFLKNIARYFDHRESMACCRALSLTDKPQDHLSYATESCRTNSSAIFMAMALGNPYSRDHFNDDSFDQMVLKAMFVEAPLEPIVGLKERVTKETKRMTSDFCDERRAAGRPLPVDVDLVLNEKEA